MHKSCCPIPGGGSPAFAIKCTGVPAAYGLSRWEPKSAGLIIAVPEKGNPLFDEEIPPPTLFLLSWNLEYHRK